MIQAQPGVVGVGGADTVAIVDLAELAVGAVVDPPNNVASTECADDLATRDAREQIAIVVLVKDEIVIRVGEPSGTIERIVGQPCAKADEISVNWIFDPFNGIAHATTRIV